MAYRTDVCSLGIGVSREEGFKGCGRVEQCSFSLVYLMRSNGLLDKMKVEFLSYF